MLTSDELEKYRKAWHGRISTASLESEIRLLLYKRVFQKYAPISMKEAKRHVDATIERIKEND